MPNQRGPVAKTQRLSNGVWEIDHVGWRAWACLFGSFLRQKRTRPPVRVPAITSVQMFFENYCLLLLLIAVLNLRKKTTPPVLAPAGD